ncbi:MAG: glycyl-radical enzyme activating protein [Acidobacteriota bacterium]
MIAPSQRRPAGLTGTIFNVQRASFHDGPGIRTTVFLKGCPLRCPWCHNPEGMAFAPEVLVNPARCLSCGACVAACPRPGGPLPAGAALGSGQCAGCGACAEACPAAARQIAGRMWTTGELLAEILRDRLVYEESGGGVTFSGGEPLAQPAFLISCLQACQRAGLHTAVDTCGLAPREVALEVARSADLLLWDLKTLDPVRHAALTGVPLDPILANLAAVGAIGVPIWLRIPVIPGVNDEAESLGAMAGLAATIRSLRRVSLLPFHRTGAGKLERLGRTDTLPGLDPPPNELMRALAATFAATGIETTIGG